jgi:hypothetical protein
MKLIITESQFRNIFGFKSENVITEQDDRVTRAANGDFSCGAHPRSELRGSERGEAPMSEKQLKKYNEKLYNDFLVTNSGPDYQERRGNLSQNSDLNSVSGKLNVDQKFSLIYNLTNRLLKNPSWFFNRFIKKELNLPSESPITDKIVLDMIKKKGGFDAFKVYYLTDIMM